MLDLKRILNETEKIKGKLSLRNFDLSIIDKIVELGKNRSKVMFQLEEMQAKRNKTSKKIGELKSKKEDVSEILQEVALLKEKIIEIEEKEKEINKEVKELLLVIPNIPSSQTPKGESEEENQVIEENEKLGRGKILQSKPHYEIMEELNIIDFERATKLSGSRFVIYKNDGSKLLRALKDFMLDTHIAKGYFEYTPPVLVNKEMLIGTGQLPKFKDDLFEIKGSNKWLIPTAEVPLTNIFSNEIIDLEKTKKMTAYTQCFRAESGSGGRDTKGIIRMHQFNKVEIVKITKPENSWDEFNELVNDAEEILKLLELPYRKVSLCSGDIGFSAKRTIDLEVWMPSENKYREISSISHFDDFQARRTMIRYKENDEIKFANTLNGSGLAIDRCIAAIVENNLNKDGTILVPKKLIPYFGKSIIK